jgi:hypothetical protein
MPCYGVVVLFVHFVFVVVASPSPIHIVSHHIALHLLGRIVHVDASGPTASKRLATSDAVASTDGGSRPIRAGHVIRR